MTKYYIDESGNYLGGFDGVQPPARSIEVPHPPKDAKAKWVSSQWEEPAVSQEERQIRAAQKLALLGPRVQWAILQKLLYNDNTALNAIKSKIDEIKSQNP